MNPSIGAISKWKYLLLPKLWCVKLLSDPYNPGTVRKIFMPNTGTISKDSMSTPIWKPKLLMPNQLARYSKYIPTEVYLDSYVTSSDTYLQDLRRCIYIYMYIYGQCTT